MVRGTSLAAGLFTGKNPGNQGFPAILFSGGRLLPIAPSPAPRGVAGGRPPRIVHPERAFTVRPAGWTSTRAYARVGLLPRLFPR